MSRLDVSHANNPQIRVRRGFEAGLAAAMQVLAGAGPA